MDKNKLFQLIDQQQAHFKEHALYIARNPELGHQEHQAAKRLTQELMSQGFSVEMPYAGLETGFRAQYQGSKPGPVIALLAEYDALPEIGHGCGHNLIGVMSVAAACVLKEAVASLGGCVVVLGTPAEETDGAKVRLAEQGLLAGIDAAMMVHPSSYYERSGVSMAMEALQFDFYGRTAHAAAAPHRGINALDGLVNTYVNISTLRQQLASDVRVHGIISKGGEAANVIPDHAQAQYYVRAKTREGLREVLPRIADCVKAGALASGCTFQISNYQTGYDNLITNETLSAAFTENLMALGVDAQEIHHGLDHGSLDMGNVSQVVPAIHPYIRITPQPVEGHTREFAAAAASAYGLEAMLLGAKCLAATGWDILANPELVDQMWQEFRRTREKMAKQRQENFGQAANK